jgi:hypothetical protein
VLAGFLDKQVEHFLIGTHSETSWVMMDMRR